MLLSLFVNVGLGGMLDEGVETVWKVGIVVAKVEGDGLICAFSKAGVGENADICVWF